MGAVKPSYEELADRVAQLESRLSEQTALYAVLADYSQDIILFIRRHDGRILEANAAAAAYGYSREELLALTINDLRTPESLAQVPEQMREADVTGTRFESFHRRRDGTSFPVEVSSVGATVAGERVLVSVVRDITERNRAEETIKKSEERYRSLFSEMMSGCALHSIVRDAQGEAIDYITLEVNQAFEQLLGVSRAAVIGKRVSEVLPPDELRYWLGIFGPVAIEGHATRYQAYSPANDKYFEGSAYCPEPGQFAVIFADITERKRMEEALQSSLREKEALLREVHHRVKNNLQVITSLLRLEAARTEHAAAKSVLGDMQGRIRSMALLHESLYRSGRFAAVDLGAYLRQLTAQLLSALAASPGLVHLDLELASVQVDMDQAMSCGLIVNELVSNSLLHGFPEGRSGEVRVELRPLDGGPQVRLQVSDNGVGLPADFEAKRGQSLGLQLVSDLVRQLGGTLEIGPGPEVVSTVTFTSRKPVAAANPA